MEGTLDLASVSSGSPSYETFLKVEILFFFQVFTYPCAYSFYAKLTLASGARGHVTVYDSNSKNLLTVLLRFHRLSFQKKNPHGQK